MEEGKEFLIFLVVGLAILGILLVVFNLQYGPPTGAATLPFGSPIFVGNQLFENIETFRASFDANNFLQSTSYDLGARRVSSGLIFGASSIKLDLGEAQSVLISFDVANTNGYGPVVVKLDGKPVVEENLDIGRYEYTLPAGRQLELAAGSSQWRLWAPALYDMENIRIVANTYPRERSSFSFKVDEPENVQSARMDFALDSNAGALLVKLNGDVVYDGALNNKQSVFIDSSKLDKLNVITFDARPDSRFAGRTTIALTRITEQQKDFVAIVNLTFAEHAKFSGGTLAFDVVDVFKPGGYSVKITNNNVTLLNEFVKLEKGYFELTLKKEHLRPGINIVTVRPLDNAAFNLQGFLVRL